MPAGYAVNCKCWINAVHEFMKRGHNVLGTLGEVLKLIKEQCRLLDIIWQLMLTVF